MKRISLISLLISSLFMQNCIKHDSGGVSATNIVLYSSKLITEAATNDGTFDETITVTVRGTTFVDDLNTEDFDTRDLPDGLTVTVTRIAENKVEVRFFGQATSHSFCSNGKMSFFFKSTAFSDGQLPISFEVPLDVQYISPVLTYFGSTVDENVLNDGSITDAVVINTQNGGTFALSSGTYVLDTDYTLTGLPAGLTPVLTANSSTQATLSFTGNATEHTPAADTIVKLKWNASALSADFCAALSKKDLTFVFYRSVLMYAVDADNGNLMGTETSARAGADALCDAGKPTLPDDYDGFRAYITIDATDDIDGMDETYGIPDNVIVESLGSDQLGADWDDLLDGTIDTDLDTADVVIDGDYWTGSLSDGTEAAGFTCNGWESEDVGDSGHMGLASDTGTAWLDDTDDTCDQPHQVLCVAYVTE